MTTNSSVKLDAFDLAMTALRGHENKHDRIVEQLTFLAKSLEKTSRRFTEEVDAIKHEKLSRTLDIRIPVDLLQKAHELGLNVSAIFENALKESVAQRTK